LSFPHTDDTIVKTIRARIHKDSKILKTVIGWLSKKGKKRAILSRVSSYIHTQTFYTLCIYKSFFFFFYHAVNFLRYWLA